MERQRIYQWLFTLAIATFGTLLSAYVYLGLKKSDDSRVLAELQTETYHQSVRASLLFTQGGSILCWLFNQRIVVPDNCHPNLLFLACFSGSARRSHSVLLCSEQTV